MAPLQDWIDQLEKSINHRRRWSCHEFRFEEVRGLEVGNARALVLILPDLALLVDVGQVQTQNDAHLHADGTQQATEARWLYWAIKLTHCISGQAK